MPVHKMPSTSTMRTEDDENAKFDCPEDEVVYYRDRYRRIQDMLDETRAELDDFQASSKELEDELEKELSATEKQQCELRERITRLEAEKDDFKAKLLALQKLHSSTTTNMHREMDNLRSERDKTLVALRELEMGNDELERNERVAVSSLLDLESKYNRAIEEKTLLEQEVIHRQELEEECQRLKDELRDSSNEVAILRDQIARTIPTPPSSVSVHMSPVQEASQELYSFDVPRLSTSDSMPSTPFAKTPEFRHRIPTGIPRSNTASSIPKMSPSAKRFSATISSSPSGISVLSRSTTSRNLAANAAPVSPAMLRHRSGQSAPSPARSAHTSNLTTKNKGFKLLHAMQARLKATDDKLSSGTSRRNVSAPGPSATSGRTVSTAISVPTPGRAAHARIAALTQESTTPLNASDQTGVTLVSPNGWILVSDGEETPTNQGIGIPRQEAASPLELIHCPPSSTSTATKGLPVRPGIPSPLASLQTQLAKSTNPRPAHRPPSRTYNLSSSTMTPSRTLPESDSDARPMSPSMLPQPSRSLWHSASPGFEPASTPFSRPPSLQETRVKPGTRAQHNVLGRGRPPSSPAYPTHQPLSMSVSISTPNNAGLRRSARRSSLGVAEATLPPSSIPAPRGTPGRPISVHVFGDSTPPPVPRIPSAHLRESVRRNGMLGFASGRQREKAGGGGHA